MRSKKALALLVAASMVFTMNTVSFAGVNNESENVSAQSTNSMNEKVSDNDIKAPEEGEDVVIDKRDADSVTVDSGTFKKILDAAEDADSEYVTVKLKVADAHIPTTAIKSAIEHIGIANVAKLDMAAATDTNVKFNDVKNSVGESLESAAEKYTFSITATLITGSSTNISLFSEPITLEFDAGSKAKALKNPLVVCSESDAGSDYVGTEHLVDEKLLAQNVAMFTTNHLSSFVIGEQVLISDELAHVSANFAQGSQPVYVLHGEELCLTDSQVYVEFIEDADTKAANENYNYLVKTANKDNGYTAATPYVTVDGSADGYTYTVNAETGETKHVEIGAVKPVKWVKINAGKIDTDYPQAEIGKGLAFDETKVKRGLYEDIDLDYDGISDGTKYALIVEPLAVYDTVSVNEGGHVIKVKLNTTPAYTGKKLGAGSIVEALEVDGQRVSTALIKIKTKGKKKVGSEVTVTLKSIKGLEKEANKAIKNKVLGKVKIRPIQASRVVLWTNTIQPGDEGRLTVSMKKGTAKKVTIATPGNYKLDKNVGTVLKAKKLKIKKGFTYDSATKYITFDGTVVSGTVKVKIASK